MIMRGFYFKIILVLVILALSAWLCGGSFAMGQKPEAETEEESGVGLYEPPSEEDIEEIKKKRKAATVPLPETGAVKEVEGGRLGDIELTPHGR
jgi:hypothetical protein